jgi:phosphate transport system substrate-binding protein
MSENQTTKENMMKKFIAIAALAATVGAAAAQEKIVIDGSTTVGPIAKAFAEYYMAANPDINITVSESGSGNGRKSLAAGTCDIAAMSRPFKDAEFTETAAKGIQPTAHVVALDGLPILVHPSNPVQDLTVEQVRKIFLGEIANWKDVGGPDLAIVTISRDTNSGTYETFAKLVMSKQKIHENCEYVGSNGAIRQRVQSTPAAIGYAGLGFVDKTVKALKINGVYPSPETVQTGEYPVARPLYLYTNKYPKLGSALYQFMTIHLTEDGQEMVEEIGFVPVTAY